ncbi:MAG: aldose epimerase family protein [Bacilli bacterium]
MTYVLKNEHLEAHFISFGACIVKLIDLKTGINIIVGHEDMETYRKNNPGYMNAIIGRHSGRITDFYLDGKRHEVAKNINGIYQLHGGFKGFNAKEYSVEVGEDWIKFSASAEDGEEGFPGAVAFSVTYRLRGRELHLLYEAEPTKKTILSLTNHAYFNLNGDPEKSILNHELFLNADRYLMLDENFIPYGAALVENTPLDFRKMKPIGQEINADFEQLKIAGGFDHPYLVNRAGEMSHVATLRSPLTGLSLEVHSTEDVVVFYAGNMINEDYRIAGGIRGYKNMALCLETQGVPNSPNIPEFADRNLYGPNEKYTPKTVWKLADN